MTHRESLVLVVAHPDDETISAGGLLLRHTGPVTIVHVTDGAPRNLQDAGRYGFANRDEYASARRAELFAALQVAGLGPEHTRHFDVPDQEASQEMASVARALAPVLADLQPERVVTHPYEGGHPDHDACALAVHAACHLLQRDGIQPPSITEMTSYHRGETGWITGEFLPANGPEAWTLMLGPEELEQKRRMVECFGTQRDVLCIFALEREAFRPALRYDWTQPPHPGPLLYEQYDWGMHGERWRALAAAAHAELGIAGPA